MTKFWKPLQFKDDIQLGDEIIHIEFYPEDVMEDYFNALRKLIAVEKRNLSKEKNASSYAEQFITLCCCVFGEQTKKIFDYFDNNYTHAIDRLVPYLTVKVAPIMKLASKEKAQRIKRMKRKKL